MGAATPAVAFQETAGSSCLLPEDGVTSLLPGLDLLKNQESVLLLCLLLWVPELRASVSLFYCESCCFFKNQLKELTWAWKLILMELVGNESLIL